MPGKNDPLNPAPEARKLPSEPLSEELFSEELLSFEDLFLSVVFVVVLFFVVFVTTFVTMPALGVLK